MILAGCRSAPSQQRRAAASSTLEIIPSVLDRIRTTLGDLKMPRAPEVLDQAVRQLERAETGALEVIDTCSLRSCLCARTGV